MADTPTQSPKAKRKFVSLGEIIALAALIISGLGLYLTWQDRQNAGPTEIVEKKSAIPLVLRGTVEDDGKSIVLAPVESTHALESATLTLPGGKTIELGGSGELDADDLEAALPKSGTRKGDGSVRANVSAAYVEAGHERTAKRAYVLRYRWEGGGLFDDTELRFIGLSRG